MQHTFSRRDRPTERADVERVLPRQLTGNGAPSGHGPTAVLLLESHDDAEVLEPCHPGGEAKPAAPVTVADADDATDTEEEAPDAALDADPDSARLRARHTLDLDHPAVSLNASDAHIRIFALYEGCPHRVTSSTVPSKTDLRPTRMDSVSGLRSMPESTMHRTPGAGGAGACARNSPWATAAWAAMVNSVDLAGGGAASAIARLAHTSEARALLMAHPARHLGERQFGLAPLPIGD